LHLALFKDKNIAPRPGLDEIVAFLVGRGFSESRAIEIAEEFLERWYVDHIDPPDSRKFLLWLEGEL